MLVSFLSTEMSGFPLLMEAYFDEPVVGMKFEVNSLKKVDVEGRPYAIPTRITMSDRDGNIEQLILVDEKSIHVNHYVDPALFRIDHLPVREIVDNNTGRITNVATGRVTDFHMREITSKTPVAAATPATVSPPSVPDPQPPSGWNRWRVFFSVNAIAVVLLLVYFWRKKWGVSSR